MVAHAGDLKNLISASSTLGIMLVVMCHQQAHAVVYSKWKKLKK
jgi:hypothetical protein